VNLSPDKQNVVEAVVLAAGKGTRMKSDLAKVLHPLAGKPMLSHVLATLRETSIERTIVVVGHQAERVRAVCTDPDLKCVLQEPQLGTGHAVQVAAPHLQLDGFTLVLNGDVPLMRSLTIQKLLQQCQQQDVAAAVLTCQVADAGAYGRIVKDAAGRLLQIVEARDATPAQLGIGEFNTGVYCFRTSDLMFALSRLTNDNDQQEYYLTDTIAHLVAAGRPVVAVVGDDPDEVVGINTVAELAAAERLYLSRQS
jgi:bifunctional UDP-N-acetylglucosamine pyrophosphorylase/glucosamine-1-phosphate N-acetyltransferase